MADSFGVKWKLLSLVVVTTSWVYESIDKGHFSDQDAALYTDEVDDGMGVVESAAQMLSSKGNTMAPRTRLRFEALVRLAQDFEWQPSSTRNDLEAHMIRAAKSDVGDHSRIPVLLLTPSGRQNVYSVRTEVVHRQLASFVQRGLSGHETLLKT